MVDELQFLDPELTRHWRYFLLLESEFEIALRYVEPDEANADTFSLEFAQQLLAICAQFETVAKLLCARRVPGSNSDGIENTRRILIEWRPGLVGWGARFYPRNERIAPFIDWRQGQAPSWWRAYNRIKHSPTDHVRLATLDSVTKALVAVGLLTVAYLDVNAQPGSSRLFDLQGP